MTAGFVAVHRGSTGSLAVARPWLTPDEFTACASAVELLGRLQALLQGREQALQQAQDSARQAGHAQGVAQALRETAPQLQQSWQRAADDAVLQAQSLREAAVALALQIVERIAAGLAPADVVAALARQAAHALLPDQPAVLRLHPEVAAALQALPPQALAADGAARLQLRADASLAPLDCVFDTPAGQLIAGLPTQLARIGHGLHAAAAQVDA